MLNENFPESCFHKCECGHRLTELQSQITCLRPVSSSHEPPGAFAESIFRRFFPCHSWLGGWGFCARRERSCSFSSGAHYRGDRCSRRFFRLPPYLQDEARARPSRRNRRGIYRGFRGTCGSPLASPTANALGTTGRLVAERLLTAVAPRCFTPKLHFTSTLAANSR